MNSETTVYDVLIVGAGIHGAGIAQACAAQGWKVLLLEKYAQPACGTSSRSSKLIHGGLRYLETGQFKLVYECLRERRLLCKNAPDLVSMQKFYLPVYKNSARSAIWIALGLCLYWLLACCAKDARFRFYRQARARQLAEASGLNVDALTGLFIYQDAQTNDKKLTQAVLASAHKLGAFLRFDEQVVAIHREGELYEVKTNTSLTHRAKVVINAAGPWLGEVHQCLSASKRLGFPSPKFSLVRGSHLLAELPAQIKHCYLEAPEDKRPFFVLPWEGRLLIGTTEQAQEHVTDELKCSDSEKAYLLAAFNYYFPQFKLSSAQLLAEFSGLRVLPGVKGSINKKSRDTELWQDASLPAYWAVCGGKLTAYRATAEQLVEKIAGVLAMPCKSTLTRDIKLSRDGE